MIYYLANNKGFRERKSIAVFLRIINIFRISNSYMIFKNESLLYTNVHLHDSLS